MSLKPDEMKHERRRFERVNVERRSGAHVTDTKGKKLGNLRQIGRGGFLMETAQDFSKEKKHKFVIVDSEEELKCHITATYRYGDESHSAFEFKDLDADAAVKVGILIGKFYVSDTSKLHLEDKVPKG